MHISIPLENPYPVEITTALKFDFVIEKIDFEVWGAFLSRCWGPFLILPGGPMDTDDDAVMII
jgi:hypothetical protein